MVMSMDTGCGGKCDVVVWRQGAMSPEEKAAALACMSEADRAAALVRNDRVCVWMDDEG